MELILKTNNENSISKIIELARKLNVTVEQRTENAGHADKNKDELKKRILNFKGKDISSFGDAGEWQRHERTHPRLPFSK